MKKKLLAILCMLALAVSMFTVASATTTETFQVGYAKVDINPYAEDGTILPLPLKGYGNTLTRLADPQKIDDNGDGAVNADDGLFATCIAISQGDETLLLIAMDISVSEASLVDQVRESICTEISGISPENIMVTASHTHGAPDLGQLTDSLQSSTELYTLDDGTQITGAQIYTYLNAWKTQLVTKLTQAAATAIADQAEATMSKGTIDAGNAAGRVMNAVRHYTQTDSDGDVYVRGSSFNNNVDGVAGYDDYDGAAHVSDADDALHILQFSFAVEGKEDIILANWRSHPTINSKLNSATFYNITSDYINAFRYGMEQENYRAAFFQGAGGNIASQGSLTGESEWITEQASATGKLAGVVYGGQLADVALTCLEEDMASVATGAIRTYQKTYGASMQFVGAGWLAAAQEHLAGTCNGDPCAHTVDGVTYLIASDYHANSIVNRSAYNETTAREVEVNTILIGNEVAFVTLPYEPSDRYSADATLATANNYNDWALLSDNNAAYGTPFVLGYANDHVGYIPNNLAYIYNEGSAKYAAGSYESQTSPVAQATGEKIIALLDDMLDLMSTGSAYRETYCEHCDQVVTWMPMLDVNMDTQTTMQAGHYYLVSDYNSRQKSISAGTVCLDLNGYTYSGINASGASRAFSVTGGVLNIMDTSEAQTGKLQGRGVKKTISTAFSGGTISVSSGAQLNLYSGTLTQQVLDAYNTKNGGVVSVSGTFNMYGGTVTGGEVTNVGGNIYVTSTGSFCMSGGTVTNGVAASGGKSVFVLGSAQLSGNAQIAELRFNVIPADKLTISGAYTGTVTLRFPVDALAVGTDMGNSNGANLHDANISIYNSTLSPAAVGSDLIASTVARCEACGKDVAWGALTDAAVDAMSAMTNGHYYLTENVGATQRLINAGNKICLDLNGYTFSSTNTRAFILYSGSTLNIMDTSEAQTGTVQGRGGPNGAAIGFSGGTIYVNEGAVLNLYSGTLTQQIVDGYATKTGGVVAVKGEFNMYGGTVIGGVTSTNGGNIYVNTTGIFRMSGGTVTNGTAGTAGGSVYVLGSVELSGNAQVYQLSFASNDGESLTIKGAYAGTAQLSFGSSQIAQGTDIGNSDNADLSGATITILDSTLVPAVVDGNLVAAASAE